MQQVFKTYEGARKRAAFENTHCDKRWCYVVVRCDSRGEVDNLVFEPSRFKEYTYRLSRDLRRKV